MKATPIVSSGLTGTSAMTLFSYIVSENKEKNFKEPEVLAQLLQNMLPQIKKEPTQVAGWSMHYSMGMIFALIYEYLWQERKVKPTIKNGLILGGLSGLAGIMVWKLVFKIHPNPPKLHFNRYYGHLFLAHLVFGTFAAIGHNLVQNKGLSHYPGKSIN
ncbi:hypothetical protein [Rubrolithibacter danxiaensis]|uniref:hypothetical protein n=1 Tax=Rubrolithibacter danxiaensis TaxID=3390805 RepID=UPI003BF79DB9